MGTKIPRTSIFNENIWSCTQATVLLSIPNWSDPLLFIKVEKQPNQYEKGKKSKDH